MTPGYEEDEDPSFGDEEPDGFDTSADDADDATYPCPYCRRPIYEDSPRCPHCERYISAEDAPRQRKSWWLILGVVICLLAALAWFR